MINKRQKGRKPAFNFTNNVVAGGNKLDTTNTTTTMGSIFPTCTCPTGLQ